MTNTEKLITRIKELEKRVAELEDEKGKKEWQRRNENSWETRMEDNDNTTIRDGAGYGI